MEAEEEAEAEVEVEAGCTGHGPVLYRSFQRRRRTAGNSY